MKARAHEHYINTFNLFIMFQESHMRKIAALVGVAVIVALSAYTYYAFTQAKYTAEMPVIINVTGEGEVFAASDIASFSFSVLAKEDTASAAQNASAQSINAITEYLVSKGIDTKDIKTTGYYLNPRYDYSNRVCTQFNCPPQGEPKLVGYEVSQSISVKVRKIDDVGMLISGVGELGATNISGPSFTIDDDSTYKARARELAIKDAKEKAGVLARDLGVRIVRMTGYWENDENPPMYGYGMGGDMLKAASMESSATVPDMPVGENTITSQVTITYEVK